MSALGLSTDKQIRSRSVEHHYTLPTLYKQKKRAQVQRKNATLERTTTKRNQQKELLTELTQKSIQLDSTKMHYHNRTEMPKYLFGERIRSPKEDEIYLNKSGWVQVNQREKSPTRFAESSIGFKKYSGNGSGSGGGGGGNSSSSSSGKNNSSKLEALISRNEKRKVVDAKLINRVKCAIDPKVSAMLSERPGFLPIKRFDDVESPPPITPIISPPPAFQDHNSSLNGDDVSALPASTTGLDKGVNKGMVFSRSFEYQTTAKPFEYSQTFSKSFDYDFLSPSKEERAIDKEKNFPNLTGVSPNYLSKKPAEMTLPGSSATSATIATPTPTVATVGRQPSSTYQQYLEPIVYAEPMRKNRVRNPIETTVDRSRRGQFAKQESSPSSGSQKGFRPHLPTNNKRLNSCDSGARSGKFDELKLREMNFSGVFFLNVFLSPNDDRFVKR